MKIKVNGKGLHGCVPAIASGAMALRLLICAALSDGPSQIRCEAVSRDISVAAGCLRAAGCALTYTGGTFYAIPQRRPERAMLDCRESAAAMWLLLPVMASLGIKCRVDIGNRLIKSPLSTLYSTLSEHGEVLSPEDSDPLLLSGRLRGGSYRLRADASPMLISGLLFALPLLSEDSKIVLSGKQNTSPQVEMTLNALRTFGIKINRTPDGYSISGKQKYRTPGAVSVEGDWTSGAYWLCAAALGSPLTVSELDGESLQGDRQITELLSLLKKDSAKVLVDAGNIPDLIPAVSVVAAVQNKTTVLYNTEDQRLKELTCAMLRAIGATVTPIKDGLRIKGAPNSLYPATVEADGDFRIAMAAAIASVAAGDVTILDCDAPDSTYPAFFESFRRLGGTVIIR